MSAWVLLLLQLNSGGSPTVVYLNTEAACRELAAEVMHSLSGVWAHCTHDPLPEE